MSSIGPGESDNKYLDRVAEYWWDAGKMVWWSCGQDGYYFSNLRNKYMSRTHVHVYHIEVDEGFFIVKFSTKVNNVKYAKGAFVAPDLQTICLKISKICQKLFSAYCAMIDSTACFNGENCERQLPYKKNLILML